jgi:hypothetical protein
VVKSGDITHLIERLEAFEDRSGVSLEGLYADINSDTYRGNFYSLDINGELHPREGTELDQDIELVATAYDTSGRVIGVGKDYFKSESFFGFEAFSLSILINGIPAAKVRVYPKNL